MNKVNELKYNGKSVILCPDCGELANWNSYHQLYMCTKYYENHILPGMINDKE
jgi:hypothetical protein